MNSDDLVTKLHDHPFKPFRIRMVNSTTYDVREPWMLMVGPTSAVIATETQKTDRGHEIALDWKTVSIHHMMEFADLPSSTKGSKRKG
jgi:hypothetical protein